MSICGGESSTPAIGRAATIAMMHVVLNLSFAGVRATIVPARRRLEYLQGIALPARAVENQILAATPEAAKVKPAMWTFSHVSIFTVTTFERLTFSYIETTRLSLSIISGV